MLVLNCESLARTHIPERAEVIIRVPGQKPIVVTVQEVSGFRVKLGIQADQAIEINRGEIDQRKYGWGEKVQS